MNNTDYEREVMRTAGTIDGLACLDLCALGIAGESGEIIDHIKKVLYHDHALDHAKLKKEMGDLQWYLSRMMLLLCTNFDEVTDINSAKLRLRYPDGFTTEASKARVDVQEGGE